jgi:hypothetical protein
MLLDPESVTGDRDCGARTALRHSLGPDPDRGDSIHHVAQSLERFSRGGAHEEDKVDFSRIDESWRKGTDRVETRHAFPTIHGHGTARKGGE